MRGGGRGRRRGGRIENRSLLQCSLGLRLIKESEESDKDKAERWNEEMDSSMISYREPSWTLGAEQLDRRWGIDEGK